MELSLDDILKTRRQSSRRGRGGRRSDAGRPAAPAGPVGGVQKANKQGKQPKAAPAAPAAPSGGETKIMISNLVSPFAALRAMNLANPAQPLDVEQNQLQVCKTFAGL